VESGLSGVVGEASERGLEVLEFVWNGIGAEANVLTVLPASGVRLAGLLSSTTSNRPTVLFVLFALGSPGLSSGPSWR
jgi:hypothetical protein